MIRVLAWPSGKINELNPYVRMMYSVFVKPDVKLIAFKPFMYKLPQADAIHIHWPEGIFEGRGGKFWTLAALKALMVLRAVDRVRRREGIAVLTIHNLDPHMPLSRREAYLWRWFFSRLLSRADLLISLTEDALGEFRKRHPIACGIPATIVPHPNYRSEYPRIGRLTARKRRGYNDQQRVIGMIGSLRHSKKIPEAIEVFRSCAESSERLLITGACQPDQEQIIRSCIGRDERITFEARLLSKEELAEAFDSIDLCLINQTGTMNSGTALLALSLDCPIVAPTAGSLSELKDLAGAEWIKLFKPPLASEQFRSILDTAWTEERSPTCRAMDHLDPVHLSRLMLDAFEDALHKKKRQR